MQIFDLFPYFCSGLMVSFAIGALLVKNPEDRSFYTSGQCKLINGKPFSPEDQDDVYENLIKMEQGEVDFWDSVGVDPNYIYELAETGWEEFI